MTGARPRKAWALSPEAWIIFLGFPLSDQGLHPPNLPGSIKPRQRHIVSVASGDPRISDPRRLMDIFAYARRGKVPRVRGLSDARRSIVADVRESRQKGGKENDTGEKNNQTSQKVRPSTAMDNTGGLARTRSRSYRIKTWRLGLWVCHPRRKFLRRREEADPSVGSHATRLSDRG